MKRFSPTLSLPAAAATAFVTIASIAATGVVAAQSATYAIEPTHTFVNFEAKHFGTSTLRGRFDKKRARSQLIAPQRPAVLKLLLI